MSHASVPTVRPRGLGIDPPSRREVSLALVTRPFTTIRTWRARHRERRMLQELATQYDDHLLADIGITREEALRGAAKWFWER